MKAVLEDEAIWLITIKTLASNSPLPFLAPLEETTGCSAPETSPEPEGPYIASRKGTGSRVRSVSRQSFSSTPMNNGEKVSRHSVDSTDAAILARYANKTRSNDGSRSRVFTGTKLPGTSPGRQAGFDSEAVCKVQLIVAPAPAVIPNLIEIWTAKKNVLTMPKRKRVNLQEALSDAAIDQWKQSLAKRLIKRESHKN
jgi:hypothetical protein